MSGGLDGAVWLSPLDGAGDECVLGEHVGAARCVRRCDAVNALATTGRDATLKLRDVRAADACVGTYAQPGKVHALCVGAGAAAPPRVVVAAAGRRADVLDLRMPDEPPLRFESGLRTQARCVAQMASGDGFVLGAVDGRVAIEYFDPSEASQSRKFAFKAHHEAGAGGKPAVAHPVNAVAFHPVHGTFATGGCDGRVNVWDGAAKKRVFQYEKLPPRSPPSPSRPMATRSRSPRRTPTSTASDPTRPTPSISTPSPTLRCAQSREPSERALGPRARDPHRVQAPVRKNFKFTRLGGASVELPAYPRCARLRRQRRPSRRSGAPSLLASPSEVGAGCSPCAAP